METKDAFMLGVCTTLAEADVCPSELITAAVKLSEEKKPEAPKKEEEKEDSGGMKFLPGGFGMLQKGLLYGAGASTLGAGALGHAGGRLGYGMLSSDSPESKDVRKEYLIKKLEDLVRERKARINNDLIQKALQ